MKIDTLVEPGTDIFTSRITGLQLGEPIFKALTLFAELTDRFLPVFNRGDYVGRISQSKVIYAVIEAYIIERDARYQSNRRVTSQTIKLKNLLKKTGILDVNGEIEQLIELIISENHIG